jgi:hypothetical protein
MRPWKKMHANKGPISVICFALFTFSTTSVGAGVVTAGVGAGAGAGVGGPV